MSLAFEWARCAPWIQAALNEAPLTHTLCDVRAMVDSGDAQFWPFLHSACITQIWDEPQAKVLHHWLVGGDLTDLLSHRPEIEIYARTMGCTRLLIGGRKGWERVLSPFGFELAGIVMAKELKMAIGRLGPPSGPGQIAPGESFYEVAERLRAEARAAQEYPRLPSKLGEVSPQGLGEVKDIRL